MKKLVLGLDLGTNWHGWSLLEIDEKNEMNNRIIRRGSYYVGQLSHPQSGTYKLGERGIYRRTRRTIRRRKQRKIDFIKLINKNSNIFKFDPEILKKDSTYKIYDLSVKGLNDELKPDELFKVLYSKLSFRGSQYKIPNYSGKTISELLLESYRKNNKVRGIGSRLTNKYSVDKNINDETGEVIIKYNKIDTYETLIFSQQELRKDLVKILNNCHYLNDSFKEEYLKIFDRQRDFSKGPGSENSPTPYGIFRRKNNEIIKVSENLWENQIKNCPVFNDLKVGYKGCLSGEIANLVSQLSFLRLNNDLLTSEQKIKIWNDIIFNQKKPNLKNFAKSLMLEGGFSWSCYPANNKNGEDKFEELKFLREMIKDKIININSLEDVFASDKILKIDNIIDEITKKYLNVMADDNDKTIELLEYNIDKESCILDVKKLDCDKLILDIDNFCNFTRYKNLRNSHWNFSILALTNYFKKNWNTKKSKQLGSYYKDEIEKSSFAEYMLFHPTDFDKKTDYIYENIYENKVFLSPNIKNSAKEAIRLINSILKFCKKNGYLLTHIILETTSKDGFSSKKYNNQIFLENKKREDLANALFKLTKENSIIEKLKVLIMSHGFNSKNFMNQDYVDLYDGESIYIDDVIKNPYNYEIDHVLPISRSALNKYENKVLTKKNNNHTKQNRTPYECFGKNIKLESIWEEKVKNQNYKLYQNLTKEFISSNFLTSQLNNVSIIMKQIVDGLKLWAKHQTDNNKTFANIEISTISGFASQKIREMAGIEKKDRNIGNEHHSIDACICAMIGSLKSWKELKPIKNRDGFIVAKTKTDIFNNENIEKYKKISGTFKLVNWELDCKKFTKFWNETLDQKIDYIYGTKKDKKYIFTGSVTDQSIYKWIEKDGIKYQVKKYKLFDSYEKLKNLNEIFTKDWEDSKNLNDKYVYETLRKIWNDFYDGKNNPFINYMNKSLENFHEWNKYINSNQVVFINHVGKEIIIGSLKFIDKKASIGVVLKQMNNSYKSGLSTKCIFLIEEKYNNKNKIYFQKETLNDLFLIKNKEKIDDGRIVIKDVIEINQLYKDDKNNIWRVTGCHIENGCLHLLDINGVLKKIEKPYSSFKLLNFTKYK